MSNRGHLPGVEDAVYDLRPKDYSIGEENNLVELVGRAFRPRAAKNPKRWRARRLPNESMVKSH